MTIIYFILILGTTIFVHELGHFIFAKRAGVYIYEFALGMGPRLLKFKRKNDETIYSLRLFPLGGFVSMAGEDIEVDEAVPKGRSFQDKKWYQRCLIVVAGVLFNFIFAFLLLFTTSMIYGSDEVRPYLGTVEAKYPAKEAGLEQGDLLLEVDGKKVSSWDEVVILFEQLKNKKQMDFKVEKKNGDIETVTVKSIETKQNGQTRNTYGLVRSNERHHGVVASFQYACLKFKTLIKTMFMVIGGLLTGSISTSSLAGPVGVYSVVGTSAAAGFSSILYLLAFLSINVGFVNLIPFPAFDGGRLLFLIIEKIKGSPVDPKIENTIHSIGFILLMGLMLYVTFNDIMRLF